MYHGTDTVAYCNDTIIGHRQKGGLHIQWQRLSIVEMRCADRATRVDGDSVTKCQERTATVCNVVLQTFQQIQRLKKALN